MRADKSGAAGDQIAFHEFSLFTLLKLYDASVGGRESSGGIAGIDNAPGMFNNESPIVRVMIGDDHNAIRGIQQLRIQVRSLKYFVFHAYIRNIGIMEANVCPAGQK